MRSQTALIMAASVLLFITSCFPSPTQDIPPAHVVSDTTLLSTDITFFLELPKDIPDDLPIHFVLLDEVTGLPYNQKTFPMQRMDAYRYAVTIRVPHKAVIKYRYAAGEHAEHRESTAVGAAVRYRMYYADGPGFAEDTVVGWDENPTNAPTARITGEVVAADTGAPIADLLISSSGVSAITAFDGSFRLEGLPPGKHPLVAYSLNGQFHPFQQEVVTEADTVTPVQLALSSTSIVEVTFEITVPEDTVPTVPIKLAGSLQQLGNTFGELAGGVSLAGDSLPQLQDLGNGRYAVTLMLPAEILIEYKYTLGDGFWNAEHHPNGRYMLRQLLLSPDAEHILIEDQVSTWRSSNSPPIWFDVVSWEELPPGERMFIQFKLVGWMEPLPMWVGGEGRWGYLLNSPTNFSHPLPYRFCRSGQCGAEVGVAVEFYDKVHTVPSDYSANDTLITVAEGWKWNQGSGSQAVIPAVSVNVRPKGFIAGVEMAEYYRFPQYQEGAKDLDAITAMHANSVVLTPSWSVVHPSLPIFDPIPGSDLLFGEQMAIIQANASRSLRTILSPSLNLPVPDAQWWATARRDFPWWQVWFEQYQRFILHHASLAQQTGAAALVLDGNLLAPAFPGGALLDGSPSNVPPDAGDRWTQLIAKVRAQYSGEVFIRLDIDTDVQPPNDILELFDGVYLLFSAEIGDGENTPLDLMAANAGDLLDQSAFPYALQHDLKVIVAIAYPSAHGASRGCITSPSASCIPAEMLSPFRLDFDTIPIDLHEQAEAYHAVLMAVNERPWVSGVVSVGYFPPVALLDKSLSIHGKPAQDVLSFWYKGINGLE